MSLSAAILAAVLAAPADGYTDLGPGAGIRRVEDGYVLRRVDDGVADRGPLSLSLRELQVDLSPGSGFRGVYRIESRDDLLMRQSGALVASFSRSTYRRNQEKKVVSEVPAGTVFSIGFPQWIAGTEREARAVLEQRRAQRSLEQGYDGVERSANRSKLNLSAQASLRANVLADLRPRDLRLDLTVADAPVRPATRVAPGLPSGVPIGWRRASDGAPDPIRADAVAGARRHLVTAAAPGMERAAARVDMLEGASAPRFIADEAYRRARLERLLSGVRSAGAAPTWPGASTHPGLECDVLAELALLLGSANEASSTASIDAAAARPAQSR
ncbi:MAG TPA: hypothetical protein PKC43_01795 [Phycisphaerales bacterium]|nr:hypothetical protein [Phycisphaerales bacterium]HMP36158.1 hypothetical protein [Phycisphaerales bacterium]